MTTPELPTPPLLDRPPPAAGELPAGHRLGGSREGRPVTGYRYGRGPLSVSLLAGCHADEPVGPELLERLVLHLASLPDDAPLLAAATWTVVPHANPDGRARNAAWAEATIDISHDDATPDRIFDLASYLDRVERELPGDDVEFGFPRSAGDAGARPENRAVAAFLAEAAPYHLHASLHGMGFAHGPWFLIEPAWVERTGAMRRRLAKLVHRLGYRLHDVDRRGEKGFCRIETGFSTRPDSKAMQVYFRGRGDDATAELFRPSSMEFVLSLGGDPLTLVSEMPLFLVEHAPGRPELPKGRQGKEEFAAWLHGLTRSGTPEELRRRAAEHGVAGMPLCHQMLLQIAFLNEGLRAVAGSRVAPRR